MISDHIKGRISRLKAGAFYDMARKVHGPKGQVKDILVTDPCVYLDKSEENTVSGIDNFLTYIDCLECAQTMPASSIGTDRRSLRTKPRC